MSRPMIIAAVVVAALLALLVLLASLDREVAPLHVEKAVPHAALGK